MRLFLLLSILIILPQIAKANVQTQYKELIHEIRCVVCQGQSIAESNAPLAHDMRAKVYAELQAGKNPAEIKQYLVTRYGDSVLFSPPVNGKTFFLWVFPFTLLTLAICYFIKQIWANRTLSN